MKRHLSTLIIAIATITATAQTTENGNPSTPAYLDDKKPVEERISDAISRMTLSEKIRIIHAQSKFSSAGIPRLGFPDFWATDGPHGIRPESLWDKWQQAAQTNDSCVAFPALTCLAATWNPQLARLYGESLGEEALYRGKDMVLAPGVNINRTPLNGRNFEYLGEDPFLTARMAVPYIQGLQSKGVAACVKHFALNNDEEYRHQVNVKVSDRALHEIYLPAFKAAVKEAGAWAVMGSYNLYNSQHMCHNKLFLNGILKGEWQFDGVLVSDWGGTHDTDEAIMNGLDMEFGTKTDGLHEGQTNAYDSYYLASPYQKGILEGRYTTKELDDKVRRVLRLFYRTTMNPRRPHGFLCSDAHYAAARKIATEGIVLLKNKGGILPINPQKVRRILVVGENAIKMMTVGGGSSTLKVQHEVSPLDGLRTMLQGKATVDYARGYVGAVRSEYDGVVAGQNLNDSRSPEELISEAVRKAKEADFVVMVGGLNKQNYQDCEGHDRKEYALPYAQDRLIEALAAANRNFVYVNISGNAVEMPWIEKVPAVVQAWFNGSEAGNALAEVLTGAVCPSGKLPYTWYARLSDVAAHHLNTYPGTWRTPGADPKDRNNIIDEEYKEGIYVGYRWMDKMHLKPTFAFGHGLSYTSFSITNLRADNTTMTADGRITFTVTLKNTGKSDGAETVQLYIHDRKASTDRPEKELKGFKKVWLKAGESRDVSITIDSSALSFYDETAHRWTAEPGDFDALVGNSSDNLRLSLRFRLQ